MIKYLLLTSVLFNSLLFVACNNSSNESEKEVATPTDLETKEEQESVKPLEAEAPIENQEQAWLIGYWQSTEDPKSIVVFEANNRYSIYDGVKEKAQSYVLSNACQNSSDKSSSNVEGNEFYISVNQQDMCWFVLHLSDKELALSLVGGRGNTLRYHKVPNPAQHSGNPSSRVEGVVKKVIETGIYGLYGLELEINGVSRYFNYHVEEMDPTKWEQKNVILQFKQVEEVTEVDLHFNGQSIYGDLGAIKKDAENLEGDIQTVQGVLNILEVSGDTPGLYSVAPGSGETDKINVIAFVYDEHENLEGKEVRAYYSVGTVDYVQSIQLKRSSNTEDRIVYIREKFAHITSGIKSGTYDTTHIQHAVGGEFANYERATFEDEIRFMSVAYCSDHGCVKTSYYFWEGALIFKFVEDSHWVMHTDEIVEKRTYYDNEQEIKCLERTAKGTGGYEVIKKKIGKTKQNEIPCSDRLDRSSMEALLQLTKETADQLYPSN